MHPTSADGCNYLIFVCTNIADWQERGTHSVMHCTPTVSRRHCLCSPSARSPLPESLTLLRETVQSSDHLFHLHDDMHHSAANQQHSEICLYCRKHTSSANSQSAGWFSCLLAATPRCCSPATKSQRDPAATSDTSACSSAHSKLRANSNSHRLFRKTYSGKR